MNSLRAVLGILFLSLSLQCAAHQDRTAEWTAITLRAVVHDLPMIVTAEATKEALKRIHIEHDQRNLVIPAEALIDIPSPRLNTIQVLFETHPAIDPQPGVIIPDEWRSPRPYFYIALDFGSPIDVGEPSYPPQSKIEFANLQFHFLDGEYRERWIWRPTGPGSSRLESDCKPEQRSKHGKRCLLD